MVKRRKAEVDGQPDDGTTAEKEEREMAASLGLCTIPIESDRDTRLQVGTWVLSWLPNFTPKVWIALDSGFATESLPAADAL